MSATIPAHRLWTDIKQAGAFLSTPAFVCLAVGSYCQSTFGNFRESQGHFLQFLLYRLAMPHIIIKKGYSFAKAAKNIRKMLQAA